MQEEWKHIPGFNKDYMVSDAGRVISCARVDQSNRQRKERFMSLQHDGLGYFQVKLYKDGKPRHWKVHRLVMMAFVGLPKHGIEVNHKNGNKQDNRLSNLEYVSHKENIRHAVKAGLWGERINKNPWRGGAKNPARFFGENNATSKLTRKEVRQIRKLYSTGSHTYKSLGEMFGVTGGNISAIIKGITWRDA